MAEMAMATAGSGQMSSVGAMMLGGPIASALGNLFGGLSASNADKEKAQVDENNAIQARQVAGINAQLALERGDQVAAHGAVQAAANGGGLVGSSMGVIQQASNMAMYNARAASYRGISEGQADEYAAKVEKANATNALIGGFLGAAGSAGSDVAMDQYRGQYLGLEGVN